MFLNGKDLTQEPLAARKEKLNKLVAGSPIRFSANLQGDLDTIIEHSSKLGLEGLVAKRITSRYEAGLRSGSWSKLQFKRQQEFVIGGYVPENCSLRSIAVGYFQGEDFIFAGKVRGGFNQNNRVTLLNRLKPIATTRCPFVSLPVSKSGRWGEGLTAEDIAEIQWVRLEVVAQVKFTEWTSAGSLRHALYLGVRDDKRAKEVVREQGRD